MEKQWQDKMIQEWLDDLKKWNYVEIKLNKENIENATNSLWDNVAV
jgi:hypothetical protein